MKKITFLIFIALLLFNNVNAQILLNDNFDNYTLGNLSNDLTGQTSGQGGWYVTSQTNNIKTEIINETGRGKVIGFGWSNSQSNTNSIIILLKNLSSLWNQRLSYNNIFKMEYDLYINNISLQSSDFLFAVGTFDMSNQYLSQTYSKIINKNLVLGGSGLLNGFNTPYNYTWIKVEVFHDYNTLKTYYHIPALKFLLV